MMHFELLIGYWAMGGGGGGQSIFYSLKQKWAQTIHLRDPKGVLGRFWVWGRASSRAGRREKNFGI